MTVRGSSTPPRFQGTAFALVALGILTGGGCIASGPLAGGTSLNELASSKTRRPVVTAAYGDPGPSTDPGSEPGDGVPGQKTPPPAHSRVADSLGADAGNPRSSESSDSPAVDSFADDRFAKALAQLPPQEAAALRQMLSAIREGAPAASEPLENDASQASPGQPLPTDRVPYIVEERTERLAADSPPSSRRDPAGTSSDPGEFVPSGPVAAAVATTPISPFVAGSLAAFTSASSQADDDSPLARAFADSLPVSSVRPADHVPQGPAPPSGIAQAGATAEIVDSGASTSGAEPDPSAAAPDWHAKLAEATRALSVAIDRPGASEAERKALEAKLRLLQAIEHRFSESLVPIDGSPEEQAFWKELCGALQELFDPQATPYDDKRATLALRRLDEASRHLSKSADLDVARLAFCTAVDRFGQYDEFEEYVFSADQEALLYVEVRRFAAETVERPYPGYRTALEGSYRIVEVGGGKRWAEHIFPLAEEVSRSPRSDFFIAYRVYLPKNLPAGKYRLEFNLHDQVGDKHGSGWLDFAVKSGR